MVWLNSIGHYERRRIARCLGALLIEARLDEAEAIEAFNELGREAAEDSAQLVFLLVQQSKMVH